MQMPEPCPEIEMLLCCARIRVDAVTAARIGALASAPLDWEHLFRLSRFHGLMPLLYWHLNNLCPDKIPLSVWNKLRDNFHSNAARNLLLLNELRSLLSLFKAQGIAAVALKGPLLATTVYRSLSLREFCDLDILVPDQEVQSVKQILIARGYRAKPELESQFDASLMRFHSERAFVQDDGLCAVDLHWKLSAKQFPFPLDVYSSPECLTTVPLNGTEVTTLAPDYLLLYLAVHGAKHLWTRLEWICCLAEIIRTNQQINWNKLFTLARMLNVERILTLGLCISKVLLRIDLPRIALAKVQDDPTVRILTEQVKTRIYSGRDFQPGILENYVFTIRAMDSTADGIGVCLKSLLTPTFPDWSAIQLPGYLLPIYYFIRPLRLLGKYGAQLTRIATRRSQA
ncbi:MAG: nucleotidyltransferase family protein [Pyrinomonadaceae bacterium]